MKKPGVKLSSLLTASLGAAAIVGSVEGRADDQDRSPKLGLRTTAGSLTNVGSAGGSSSTFGGVNAYYAHYLSSQIAVSLGYRAEFDYGSGSIPLHGFEFGGRYYFYGLGTFTRTRGQDVKSDRQSLFALYGGATISQLSYFVGGNSSLNPAGDLNGSFLNLSPAIGADYSLSRHFEINAEFAYGAFVFAGSDDRYRIRPSIVSFGLSYVF